MAMRCALGKCTSTRSFKSGAKSSLVRRKHEQFVRAGAPLLVILTAGPYRRKGAHFLKIGPGRPRPRKPIGGQGLGTAADAQDRFHMVAKIPVGLGLWAPIPHFPRSQPICYSAKRTVSQPMVFTNCSFTKRSAHSCCVRPEIPAGSGEQVSLVSSALTDSVLSARPEGMFQRGRLLRHYMSLSLEGAAGALLGGPAHGQHVSSLGVRVCRAPRTCIYLLQNVRPATTKGQCALFAQCPANSARSG